MKRGLLVAFLGAVAVLSSLGSAPKQQIPAGQYMQYGGGTASCGKWLEQRKSNAYHALGQWVLGWVSAAGYYGKTLKATDSDAASAWVDQYCTRNPLDQLSDAAPELVRALQVK
jgi:hypothetical protein